MTYFTTMTSPIGKLWLLGGDELQGLYIERDPRSTRAAIDATHDHGPFTDAIEQLQEYFEGDRTSFDLNLGSTGTPFQQEVWAALSNVDHGRTKTYLQIAQAVGRPNSARAVGGACGRNPIAIIVGCHRIVSTDGSLGGFAGGVATKRWLLEHEKRQ